MKVNKLTYGLGLALLFFTVTGFFVYKVSHTYHKSFSLSNERELKVTLEAGYGTVNVSK
jgi:hypothetical protein